LVPLFDLLHSIVELTFLGGIVLATLGFITAGILLMIPGEDNNRRGKLVARNVLFGTILLLSSSMIVRFFVSQMGSSFCA
jgi:type IV secretory pathway VirB2 component (pilin)